jgi:hypothetical protein
MQVQAEEPRGELLLPFECRMQPSNIRPRSCFHPVCTQTQSPRKERTETKPSSGIHRAQIRQLPDTANRLEDRHCTSRPADNRQATIARAHARNPTRSNAAAEATPAAKRQAFSRGEESSAPSQQSHPSGAGRQLTAHRQQPSRQPSQVPPRGAGPNQAGSRATTSGQQPSRHPGQIPPRQAGSNQAGSQATSSRRQPSRQPGLDSPRQASLVQAVSLKPSAASNHHPPAAAPPAPQGQPDGSTPVDLPGSSVLTAWRAASRGSASEALNRPGVKHFPSGSGQLPKAKATGPKPATRNTRPMHARACDMRHKYLRLMGEPKPHRHRQPAADEAAPSGAGRQAADHTPAAAKPLAESGPTPWGRSQPGR